MIVCRGILFALLSFLCVGGTSTAGEVTFSGDARVRYIFESNTLFGNAGETTSESWDSRVRLNLHAKADGGSYARVRMRFVDQKWGLNKPRKDSDTLWIDIAYLGVPMGETILEAGLMKSNLTRFFQYDQSVDQAALSWEMFDAKLTAIYRMVSEGKFSIFEINRVQDNDVTTFGLTGEKKLLNNYLVKANLFYQDDQRDPYATGTYITPAEGLFWSLFFDGSFGGLALETEIAFKSSDARQSRDEGGIIINQFNIDRGDGYGWYLETEYPMGAFVPILNFGFTSNGYEADNDFGWLMIGNSNNEPIAVISTVGEAGDWFWIAPSLSYKPSEKLSIKANFVYVDVEPGDDVDPDTYYFDTLWELSGEFTYLISDGATFTWKIGALKPELTGLNKGEPASEDTAFGTYGRVQIHF